MVEIDYQRFAPYILFLILAAFAYAFVTGKLSYVWNTYEIPSAIAFIVFIIFIVWIYSNVKPGFPGRMVDTLIFYGFMGSIFRRFEGLFVDITDLINDRNLAAIKELVISDLEVQLKNEKDQSKILAAQRQIERIKQLSAEDLRKNMWIYGTRRDFSRYIWIWLSDKPIDEYAFASVVTTFNIPFGFVRRRAIFGIQANLAHSVKMLGYGRVRVRIFMPLIDPKTISQVEQSISADFIENVGLLGSAIRTAVSIENKVKEYKKRVESLIKANNELHKELARLTGQVEIARKAAHAHSFEEPTEEEKKFTGMTPKTPNYLGMLIATVFGTLLFGTLLPEYIKTMTPVTASMIGAFVGGLLFLMIVNRHG